MDNRDLSNLMSGFSEVSTRLTKLSKGIDQLDRQNKLKIEELQDTVTRLFSLCNTQSQEIKQKDLYIKRLEDTIIQYKKSMRFW
jgi:hypothetical protein